MNVVIIIQMILISSLKVKIEIQLINKEKDIIEGTIFLNGIVKEKNKKRMKLLLKKIKKTFPFM
jgi:hypothetical protein